RRAACRRRLLFRRRARRGETARSRGEDRLTRMPSCPSPRLTRRSLLVGAGAAAVLAACGGKKKEVVVAPPTTATSSSDPAKQLSMVVPSTLLLSGVDQRVALILANGDGFMKPTGP